MPDIESVPDLWLDSLRTSEVDAAIWQVFGDWLLEQGDPRGHLVLRRYEVTNLLPSSRKRFERWQQVTAAHVAHEPGWLGGRPLPAGLRLQWRDGFVVGVTIDGLERSTTGFLRALVAQPTGVFLQRLQWNRTRPFAHLTASVPDALLRQLTTLEWRGLGLDAPELTDLVTLPLLVGLRVLDLQHSELGPLAARAFSSSKLAGLETLAIGSNPLGDEGLEVVAECPRLATLEALFCGYAGVGDRGAQALVSTSVLHRLRVLSLRGNAISDALQARLASSSRLPNLETLHLHGQLPVP